MDGNGARHVAQFHAAANATQIHVVDAIDANRRAHDFQPQSTARRHENPQARPRLRCEDETGSAVLTRHLDRIARALASRTEHLHATVRSGADLDNAPHGTHHHERSRVDPKRFPECLPRRSGLFRFPPAKSTIREKGRANGAGGKRHESNDANSHAAVTGRAALVFQ
jgi:hypothetical protein